MVYSCDEDGAELPLFEYSIPNDPEERFISIAVFVRLSVRSII